MIDVMVAVNVAKGDAEIKQGDELSGESGTTFTSSARAPSTSTGCARRRRRSVGSSARRATYSASSR